MDRKKRLRVGDVLTLLLSIEKAAKHRDIGYLDADRTQSQLEKCLNTQVYFPWEAVESAMWSARMLEEKGLFMDYKKRSFDKFVKSVLNKRERYDFRYSFIMEEDDYE